MAAKLKIEKREDEIFKKSSPLKLMSQSQPNFAEMILGWFSSKNVWRFGPSINFFLNFNTFRVVFQKL